MGIWGERATKVVWLYTTINHGMAFNHVAPIPDPGRLRYGACGARVWRGTGDGEERVETARRRINQCRERNVKKVALFL